MGFKSGCHFSSFAAFLGYKFMAISLEWSPLSNVTVTLVT